MNKKLKILIVYPKDYGYQTNDSAHKTTINYAGLTLTTLAGLVPKKITSDVHQH